MFIALDGGTTRTRAWLVSGDAVLDEARAPVGVGATALDGDPHRLLEALATIIGALDPDGRIPVLAAGMIGSSLGLGHVPHVAAPASLLDLAGGIARLPLPSLNERPVYVVPGVRTPPPDDEEPDPALGDVMRGEETTTLGALRLGALAPGDTLVSIGSHWKRIVTDDHGRIAASATSMGGEIVEALRTATILADAVPGDWPGTLSEPDIEDGIARVARAGLPRALFEVRLTQLAREGTALTRLARLAGIVIGADLARWPASTGRLVVAGAPPMADAWHGVLVRRGVLADRLGPESAERAFRQGLGAIAAAAGLLAAR